MSAFEKSFRFELSCGPVIVQTPERIDKSELDAIRAFLESVADQCERLVDLRLKREDSMRHGLLTHSEMSERQMTIAERRNSSVYQIETEMPDVGEQLVFDSIYEARICRALIARHRLSG